MSRDDSEFDYDVAVVGGGPAGATAARRLAGDGYRVALIEGSRCDQPRVGETLPPEARSLLGRLGLWDAFTSLGSTPSYANQSAWGGPDVQADPFIFNPYGCGWHIDRQRFDQLLVAAAGAAGATHLPGMRVSACAPYRATRQADSAGWRLAVNEDGLEVRRLSVRAVVDATGRRATIARWVGAERRVYDRLVAVAAMYHGPPIPEPTRCGLPSPGLPRCSPGASNSSTLVEAVSDGWWYSAPVPPDRWIVTFMTDSDLCHSHRDGEASTWELRLALAPHTLARVVGRQRAWGPKVFPAASHRLRPARPSSPWLACGDAAVSVDPLSSSGIMRALRTGDAAGKAMALWLGGSAGAAESVEAYERALDDEFAAYWHERSAYYALETRWPEAPFWRRRQASTAGGYAVSDPPAPVPGQTIHVRV